MNDCYTQCCYYYQFIICLIHPTISVFNPIDKEQYRATCMNKRVRTLAIFGSIIMFVSGLVSGPVE